MKVEAGDVVVRVVEMPHTCDQCTCDIEPGERVYFFWYDPQVEGIPLDNEKYCEKCGGEILRADNH